MGLDILRQQGRRVSTFRGWLLPGRRRFVKLENLLSSVPLMRILTSDRVHFSLGRACSKQKGDRFGNFDDGSLKLASGGIGRREACAFPPKCHRRVDTA